MDDGAILPLFWVKLFTGKLGSHEILLLELLVTAKNVCNNQMCVRLATVITGDAEKICMNTPGQVVSP